MQICDKSIGKFWMHSRTAFRAAAISDASKEADSWADPNPNIIFFDMESSEKLAEQRTTATSLNFDSARCKAHDTP